MQFFIKLFKSKLYLWLIGINIAVYIAQLSQGIHWDKPALADLINWGANAAPLTLQGEPSRLLTNMFIHIGWKHLLLNMGMLALCGKLVEQKFGSLNFLFIYIVSGLFASLASTLWFAQHKVWVPNIFLPGFTPHLQLAVSAGASGALMGITGAYSSRWLVDTYYYKINTDSIAIFKAFALTSGINLVMGFMTRGVDNACHVGGLIAGLALGALVSYAPIGTTFLNRILVSVSVTIASVLFLLQGLQIPISQELINLKTQTLTELADYKTQQAAAIENAKIATEIAQDAKTAPKPVDAKTAAGSQIDLSQYLSQNAWIRDMQLSADGNKLVILAGELDNKLLIVDTKTQKVTGEIKGPALEFESENCRTLMCEGKGADTLKLSADGRFAYVSSMQKDSLTIVDLSAQSIIASMPASQYPRAFAANRSNTLAYVSNGIENTISVFDLSKQTAIGAPIKLQGGSAENLPFGHADGVWLSKNEAQLWVVDAVQNQFEVFDTTTLKTIKTISMTENYYRDGALDANDKLWVVGSKGIDGYDFNEGKNDAKNDAKNDVKLEKLLPFCRQSSYYDIATSPVNNTIAITEDDGSYSQKYVHVFKTSTTKTIGRYPVFGPQNPVFSKDGTQLYVLSKKPNQQGNAKFSLTILTLANTLDVSKPDDENELLCSQNSQ
jgi:rhomboid protease GluP